MTRTITESSKAAVHPAQSASVRKILSFAKLDFFPNPPRPRGRPSSSTPLAVSKRIGLLSSFKCFFSAPNPLTGNGQRPRTKDDDEDDYGELEGSGSSSSKRFGTEDPLIRKA